MLFTAFPWQQLDPTDGASTKQLPASFFPDWFHAFASGQAVTDFRPPRSVQKKGPQAK
jgi:hypothetical protein